MSSFHFDRWNQFKVIPLTYTLRTRNLPKFSVTSDVGYIFANVRHFGIGQYKHCAVIGYHYQKACVAGCHAVLF